MKPRQGALAIVLHTHMPYVEGFGTWPFGEEWLWEAIASSYVPMLDTVLGRAPITLSLTPVLCDQLEAPGAMERCVRFLDEIRPASHALDIKEYAGDPVLVAELRRSEAEYARVAERLRSTDLLAALGRHAAWTSAATHPVLPLLATDTGIALQLQTGIASHRRRFGGEWGGGFWLPECAHAPWLDPLLEEAGVRASCVELTGIFGLGDPRHLAPLLTEAGPTLWPIDRQTMALVWNAGGYPACGPYRSRGRRTERDHRIWNNDGGVYDHAAALTLAAEHARDFVNRAQARVADGGVCVCAFDTELLGHWWYEGVAWLAAVIAEADRAGLALTTLDDALESAEPAGAAPDGITTWGEGGNLSTWSSPAVAEFAWRARSAELQLLAGGDLRPPERALRELLALQASDWAFLETRGWAGDYARERMRGHAGTFERAIAGELEGELRNLAPELVGWRA
ncbi:MAG TPA: 1,4-alpha-glucan branching protein domain-containing protein [Solirubrobacteraceae bacterium]|nr:1,4-alpha-glucan branching protein domain-containing protein [Solirubrobacteraceae bacterium]